MRFALFAGLSVLISAGCGGGAPSAVGNWKFQSIEVPPSARKYLDVSQQNEAMKGSTLVVRDDNSYSLSLPGENVQGEWKKGELGTMMRAKMINGTSIELVRAAQKGGRDPGAIWTVVLSNDGAHLSMVQGTGSGLNFDRG